MIIKIIIKNQNMEFKIKKRNKIEPELKIAANRLIRDIEAL